MESKFNKETAGIYANAFRNQAHFKFPMPIAALIAYVYAAAHGNILPIVEIGSGGGHLARLLKYYLPGREYICVDPAPTSFSKEVILEPDYPLVADLIAARPKLVGNCIVVIHWPSPNNESYAVSGIDALRPQRIMTFYTSCGAAGSTGFQQFCKDSGGPHYEFCTTDMDRYASQQTVANISGKYKIHKFYTVSKMGRLDPVDYVLALYISVDVDASKIREIKEEFVSTKQIERTDMLSLMMKMIQEKEAK